MNTQNLPQNTYTHAQTLSSIVGEAEGFIIFARKEGPKWRQLGALPASQVDKIYDIIPRDEMVDFYFTVNTFYRVGPEMKNGLRKVYNRRKTKSGIELPGSRQEVNLQDLRCLYVDMDVYRSEGAINWRDASNLVMKLADKGIIPQPSYFANSGRGAYAIWTLRPHESKPTDLQNYKAINKALNREFKAYASLLNPDDIFDGSRLLRVPGSINSKAPEQPVRYVVQIGPEGKAYEYNLEDVAEQMGVELMTPKPKALAEAVAASMAHSAALPAPPTAKPRSGALNEELSEAGKRGMKALGARRMSELLEIIRTKGVRKGFRYKTLFILASTARIAGYDKLEATALLKDLAEDFSPSYPGTDANDIPVSEIVAGAYRGHIKKHTALGLARFFNLTAEDCREMLLRTIYTEEISVIKKRPKRTEKLKLEAAVIQEAASATCLMDLCRGLFARHGIGISKSQVSRIVRRLGLKIGQRIEPLVA